jgi:hypothetical protein
MDFLIFNFWNINNQSFNGEAKCCRWGEMMLKNKQNNSEIIPFHLLGCGGEEGIIKVYNYNLFIDELFNMLGI